MHLLRTAVPFGALLLIACDTTGPGMPRPVTLSVALKQSGGSAATLANDVTVGSGPNSIRITKVEFVLAQTELSQAETCSTPPANDDNCNELELDPLLIDLPQFIAVDVVRRRRDRKSTRLNSSHDQISYAVFCLKKKKH